MTWECKDGTPEEDHDWKITYDSDGDNGVINGIYSFFTKICKQCGKEVECSEEDIQDYYSNEDDWR